MKIAIIVWGSLYWNPGILAKTEEWYYDGPKLPIEFARISGGNRLTLVIEPHSDRVECLYAVSALHNLMDAINNLALREGTTNLNNIGFINFLINESSTIPSNSFVIQILKDWNIHHGFDAAIWSDFSSNFAVKFSHEFNLQNVLLFLSQHVHGNEKKEAKEYILKTPAQITTRFRKEIEIVLNKNFV